jgi:hypothetical protein
VFDGNIHHFYFKQSLGVEPLPAECMTQGSSSVSCRGPRNPRSGRNFVCLAAARQTNLITGLSIEGRMATLADSEDEVDMPAAVT